MRAESTLGVKLGAPAVALLHNLDGLQPRAVEREELFYAHAVSVASNREISGDILAAVIDGKNLTLEILNTELVAFLDLDGNTDNVTSAEFGEIPTLERSGLLGVDLVNKLDTHD